MSILFYIISPSLSATSPKSTLCHIYMYIYMYVAFGKTEAGSRGRQADPGADVQVRPENKEGRRFPRMAAGTVAITWR